MGTSSAPARSGWPRRASSVNVPGGPRKATRVIAGQDSDGMDEPTLRFLLDDVRQGVLSPDDAVHRLRRLPFADLGFARVDHHRAMRQGLPEAVFGPGKTPEQCAEIVAELLAEPGSGPVLLTRAAEEQLAAAMARNASGVRSGSTVAWRAAAERPGRVLVLTAGTADLPVAEECVAALTAYG